jgi:hypothetical protein
MDYQDVFEVISVGSVFHLTVSKVLPYWELVEFHEAVTIMC